jgi:hypothetical protein
MALACTASRLDRAPSTVGRYALVASCTSMSAPQPSAAIARESFVSPRMTSFRPGFAGPRASSGVSSPSASSIDRPSLRRDSSACCVPHYGLDRVARRTPRWPRSWPNFSLL